MKEKRSVEIRNFTSELFAWNRIDISRRFDSNVHPIETVASTEIALTSVDVQCKKKTFTFCFALVDARFLINK